jgi:hypothetical protein
MGYLDCGASQWKTSREPFPPLLITNPKPKAGLHSADVIQSCNNFEPAAPSLSRMFQTSALANSINTAGALIIPRRKTGTGDNPVGQPANTSFNPHQANLMADSFVSFEAGQPREFSIFEDAVWAEEMGCLVVRDRYALAGSMRRNQTFALIGTIMRACASVSSVRIEAYDANSVGREYPESRAVPAMEFRQIWSNKIGRRIPLEIIEVPSNSDRKFHDRWIAADYRTGGSVWWNLSNSVDALIDGGECSVTRLYEYSKSVF